MAIFEVELFDFRIGLDIYLRNFTVYGLELDLMGWKWMGFGYRIFIFEHSQDLGLPVARLAFPT